MYGKGLGGLAYEMNHGRRWWKYIRNGFMENLESGNNTLKVKGWTIGILGWKHWTLTSVPTLWTINIEIDSS